MYIEWVCGYDIFVKSYFSSSVLSPSNAVALVVLVVLSSLHHVKVPLSILLYIGIKKLQRRPDEDGAVERSNPTNSDPL